MPHLTGEPPLGDLLVEVINAYLEARQAGLEPDRTDLLNAHPELSDDLARFFDAHDAVVRLSRPLRDVAQAARVLGDMDLTDGLDPQTPIPMEFGAYVLFEVLGAGGMGVVYRAHHRILNRDVALKQIIAGSLASETDVQRFRNEAEAAAQLDHPNIVPIHDVGEYQGRRYLTMRLIEGGSLADHRERFRDDPRRARADDRGRRARVHYAHQRGILHRDLKPSNILLDGDGQPHVTDFGLARRLGVESTLTGSGGILGSPPYMAPEQTGGRTKEITTATDVYGLGAILYVLLTGQPPFRGESVLETMEQVRSNAPAPPRRVNPRVDRDLETICLKCLEKEARSAICLGRGPRRGPPALAGRQANPDPADRLTPAGCPVGSASSLRISLDRRLVPGILPGDGDRLLAVAYGRSGTPGHGSRPVREPDRPGRPRALGGRAQPCPGTARRLSSSPAGLGMVPLEAPPTV